MRKFTALFAVIVVLAAIGAVTALASTSTVSWHVGTSKTVKIHKGSSVKWVWSDGAPHNVKGPGFVSKMSSKKGSSYTHKFGKKGTFKIICQVHPTSMKTVVKVS